MQNKGKYMRKRNARNRKAITILASLVLILGLAVGGTLAFLTTETPEVVNQFTPSQVTVEVEEEFDGTNKTGVNVTNTSDISVYVRIQLVTYRVNEDGDRIGGTAEIPAFTLGNGWILGSDGIYYYTSPVAAGAQPTADLTGSAIVLQSYDDEDGGKQVIEVMAEAIQAEPAAAVIEAWGVTVAADGTISK